MLMFEDAWEQTRTLIEEMNGDQENHAAAMLNLGHGALAAGRITWAEAVASRAREVAASRGEDHILPFAEELLTEIAAARKTRTRHRPFSDPTHDVKDAGRLSRQLVSALRTRAHQTRWSRASAREQENS
jgi:hypothetical protein